MDSSRCSGRDISVGAIGGYNNLVSPARMSAKFSQIDSQLQLRNDLIQTWYTVRDLQPMKRY